MGLRGTGGAQPAMHTRQSKASWLEREEGSNVRIQACSASRCQPEDDEAGAADSAR